MQGIQNDCVFLGLLIGKGLFMNEWTIDLHLHTVLSPCAQDTMLPGPVVERCLAFGLDVIAVTDHNAIDNVAPFCEEGKEKGLIVVPGMELETQEGIHLVCLFESCEALAAWDEAVKPFRSVQKNDSRYFGHQWVVDRSGRQLREEGRMLLDSMTISIDAVIPMVHGLGGLCIAAHVDRPSYSVTAVLGLIPDYLEFDGVELTRHLPRDEQMLEEIARQGYKYVTACDAHDLEQIGEIHCAAYLEHWSLKELALAMKGREGRDIIVAR
jgi:PHP family Zn ribbon phosphoesterase